MNSSNSLLEKFLSNDRFIVLAGIVIVSIIAWMYMAEMYFSFGSTVSQHSVHHWSVRTFSSHFSMWIVMMVAMMLPTAGPMILTFSTVSRGQRQKSNSMRTPQFLFSAIFSYRSDIVYWQRIFNGGFTPMTC